MSLPAGFTIEPYIDGPALILNDRLVACATPLSDGGARVALCIGTVRLHYHFISCIDLAELYLAKWCSKWESEIRPLYVYRPGPFAHLQASSPSAGEG